MNCLLFCGQVFIKPYLLLGLKNYICVGPPATYRREIAANQTILILFSKQIFILFVPGKKDKTMFE